MQPGAAPAARARCSALLRWLSLRLCSRRGTLLFLLLWLGSWLLLNGLVLVRRNILSDFCTDDGSKKILEQLCADFGAGSVSGDMCLDLCVRRQVHYQQCLYYQSGKKVMAARWRGRPVVLKSKLENFSSYQPLALLDYQVRDAASGRLGPRANSSSPSLSAGRRRRPVAGGSHVLCHSGGAELPGSRRQPGEPREPQLAGPTVGGGAKQQGEDVLEGGAGVAVVPAAAGGVHLPQVVAIDVDMAFFEPKMSDILEQNCSTDDDCNFFDCSSRCDATTGHCSARRWNSNLQVVCEKIFRPWFSPTLLGAKAGLPLQVELQRAVQECAKTEGGAAGDVHQRLLHVLTRLLEEGGASEEWGRGLG
ncbi:divergent protein kinase domain 1C isoform 7-T7 [Synchiropus picturatus]